VTPSLALALASMVLAGVADFLYKRAQLAGVRATTFLWVQSATFNVCNLATALATDSLRPEPLLLLFGPLLGVTMYTSRLLFLRSLRTGDLSVNAPIFRLSFVVTAVLAIGLSGESATPSKLLGLGLACLAILGLVDAPAGGAADRLRGAAPLAAATLAFGLFGWFQKLGTAAGVPPAALLVGQGLVYLSLAVPGSMLTGDLRPNRAELGHGPICGVLLSLSFLALLMSLQTGEASVNVPINQLSFVLSAVLAALLLGERLGRRQVLGLLAAALAVASFAVPA
jgi:uncharacterized membrane protein